MAVKGVIDDYFRSFSSQLAYLEVKEGANLPEEVKGIPLPLRTFDFLHGAVKEDWEETIPFRYFLNGMVWNLAIDPLFPYAENYRRLLEGQWKNPSQYAMQLGAEALKKEKAEEALIAFRAAYLLDPSNFYAALEYGQFLWKGEHGEEQEAFNREASRLFESALAQKEDDPLANYCLAELNEAMGHYAKATAYYQQAFHYTEEKEKKEAIDQKIQSLAANTAIENAAFFIGHADYRRAIQELEGSQASGQRYDVDYYLGLSYENMGQYSQAADYFRLSLKEGGDFPQLYNELVYSLNAIGELGEAVEVASQGLASYPADISLRYNRAAIYAQLGEREKALEDCSFSLSYADISDELFNQLMLLKSALEQ